MSDVDTDISKEVSNCSNTKEPSKLKALEALEDKQKNKMLRSSNLLFQIKGNSYVAPGKLRALLEQQNLEKSSVEYQRISWEALKKSINGHVNKANIANIAYIVQDLLKENIVRGRGIFAQSIIHAQMSSPVFTHIHACLVAIVNSKLPKTGELILKRLVNNFRRAFKRNDKKVSINSAKFIGHLVNQNVAHEIIALEILTLLLENVTEDSIEVAIGFLKEVGKKLSNISPRGLNAVFNRLRSILNEGKIDKRFQYMIEVMHAIRKDKFKDHIDIITELDLVEETDQITHLIRLDDQGSIEENLDVFQFDLNFEENEDKYKQIVAEILDIDSDDDMDDNDNEDEDEDEEDENDIRPNENIVGNQVIIDNTETNMISLRRTIYLTIYSSLDYEECAHKLLKLQLKPGQEHEFCNMIVDCCAQQRTYEKFYGLLAQRFCLIKNEFLEEFIKIFNEQYDTCHRLDIVKLRNTCKLFGHLLFSDAIPWMVLECIHLNEEETTSSSRIFIKILFQELAESMGLKLLIERLRDETLVSFFRGIFPIDNPRNTRFSINFFTAIGLGGITDDLRNFLKTTSKYSNNQPTESMVAGPIPNKNIDSANKLLNKASEIMLNIKDDIKSSNINHFKVDSDSGSDNRNLNIKSKEIPKRNPDRKNTPNYSSKKKSKRSISSESTSSSKSKHKEINLLKQNIKKSKFFKDKKATEHHDIRKKNSISEKIKPSKKHCKKSRSSSSSDSSGSDSSRSSNKSKNQRSTKKLPKKYLHKNY